MKRILVIRSGAIGDFIVALPVIQLLREGYDKSWLALVAKNRVRSLAKSLVDEFFDMDGPVLLPLFRENLEKGCKEYEFFNSFDLIVSYLGEKGPVSKNLKALSRPRVICADAVPPQGYSRHITEFLLEPVYKLVDVSVPPLPSITIGAEARRRAEEFLALSGINPSARIVAVHPGSGGRRKVSPAGNFCEAANWIQERFPNAVVAVIEGEADEEHVLVFEEGLRGRCVRVRRDDLLEVAAILSKASLFLGNDSGIAHLAAAVGTPTIVVFRASDPRVWAPRGRQVWLATDSTLRDTVRRAAEEIFASRTSEGRGRHNEEPPPLSERISHKRKGEKN